MWIDALCINQLDNEERACQVSMMAQIYAGAEQVLAYLGELELPDFLPPSSNNPSVEIDQSGLVFDFDDTDQPILA